MWFRGVHFAYRRRTVFSGLGVCFEPGRTVLLGPNGAGKSTLLSLGAGAMSPARGEVGIGLGDKRSSAGVGELRRACGLMPQDIAAVGGLRVREQVAYAGWCKGLSRAGAWRVAGETLSVTGLEDLADRRVGTLSGGERRRVGLAAAISHQPPVLLLDEPTAALDPVQRSRFRSILTSVACETIVVSTHQVDDLHELYDRVVVLFEGRVVFDGTLNEFHELAPRGVGDGREHAELCYAAAVGG